jgi:acetyl esterase/lipase
MNKFLKRTIIVVLILVAVLFISFKISPYPAVWIIRYGFDKEAIRVNNELEKYVPEKIAELKDVRYDENDKEALMDAYFHTDSLKVKNNLPVIVWTHGGGLISGNKGQIANYCKILAGKGYLAISIDYSIAPGGKYPVPIQQLNNALAYISANAERLHADTSFIVLAGDSGGSMISAATANVITNPDYATITKVRPGIHPGQLKGLLLYCGIYEVDNLNTEGSFGSFLETVKWAYFGMKDISNNSYAKTASVTNYLTTSFPPVFISAGNKDPLLNQSRLIANKLSSLGIPIDTLFYPDNHIPELAHEYQFTLNKDGETALERSMLFLEGIKR